MNNRTFHLSPEPGEPAGGGAASAEPANGGAAPASYLTESKFSEFSSSLESRLGELTEHLQRLTPAERREEARAEGRGDNRAELVKPNINDPKYGKDAQGFEQYLEDMYSFRSQKERAESESKQAQTQEQTQFAEYVESINEGHADRVAAIRAEIPNYDQRMAGARFGIPADSRLGLAIKSSDFSPRIMLELKENPETLARIKKAAKEYGVDRAIAIVGRLESKFELEKETAKAAPQSKSRPTNGGFGGGSGAGSSKRTDQEVMKDWN